MSRRRRAVKRPILKDAKFNSSLVSRLVNTVMIGGKKTVAQRIVYGAFDQIATNMATSSPLFTDIQGQYLSFISMYALVNGQPPAEADMQRFFGVSRLKIDPQLTGVEINPQALLTLEQQVSRNLTFSYITNLASSNQQIVRVEWALNRNWSVIAVRDENGLFGVDFLYKKSFK